MSSFRAAARTNRGHEPQCDTTLSRDMLHATCVIAMVHRNFCLKVFFFNIALMHTNSRTVELLSLLQFASGHCSVRDSRSPLAALIFKCRICAQACGQRALASGRAFCLAPTFCSAQLSQNHHYCSLAKSFTCERERASTGIMQQQQDQSDQSEVLVLINVWAVTHWLFRLSLTCDRNSEKTTIISHIIHDSLEFSIICRNQWDISIE